MTNIDVDLDIQMLEGLRDLLSDKFVELIETFDSDGLRRLDNIRKALDTMDLAVINHEAHGIKGSSRNIGANSLAEICSQMESKAKTGDAEGMQQLFSAVEQEFAAVISGLRALL